MTVSGTRLNRRGIPSALLRQGTGPIPAISAALSSVAVSSSTPTVDTLVTVTVTVRDQFGNPFPGATVLLAGGANATITQPGAVTNGSGVATGTIEWSVAGSRSVSAMANGVAITQSPAITISSGSSVLWGSEFRTAVGATSTAFLDGDNPLGGWDSVAGTPGNGAATILAADSTLTGRGNYFDLITAGPVNLVVVKDPLIAAGTSHYGRCYLRNDLTQPYVFNHALAWGGIGPPINMTVGFTYLGGQRQLFHKTLYNASGGSLGYPYEVWTPGTAGVGYNSFSSGTWYLWEWFTNYLTPTTYELTIRVSAVNAAGNITSQLFTNSGLFRQDSTASGQDLGTLQGGTVNFGLSTTGGAAAMAKFVLGNESSAVPATNEHCYMASVGFSLTGWLGDSDLGLG